VKNYAKQGGDEWVVGPGGLLTMAPGSQLALADSPLPYTASFSKSNLSANQVIIQVALLDGFGNPIRDVVDFDLWLSDTADGAGVIAGTPSGTVSIALGIGTILKTYVSKKAFRVQNIGPDQGLDGLVGFQVNDTGKGAFYPCIALQIGGKAVVGNQVVSGDYG